MEDIKKKAEGAINFLKKKKNRKLKNISLDNPKASKRRVIKLKSKGQEILDLIKKNMPNSDYTSESIRALLKLKGYETGKGDAEFYSTILRNTFYNQKISITDILGNKRFKYNLLVSKYADKSRCFTNDRLYWITKIYLASKNDLNKDVQDSLYINDAKISIATISSVQNGDIKQGFVQDFDRNFSIIGTDQYIKRDFKELKYDKFAYDGNTYNYNIGDDGSIVVFNQNYSNETIGEAIKKIKYIESKSAKSDSLKVKTIKNGEDELCYISQKIEITDYLPGVVIFANPSYYTALVEVEFDTMLLEKLCNKKLGENEYSHEGFLIDELKIGLDELEMLITFLNAEARISGNESRIKQTTKLSNEFIEIRSYYNEIKQSMNSSFRLLLRFYDSFVNRINLDTCDALLKKFLEQRADNESTFRIEYINKVKNLIENNGLNDVCIKISKAFASTHIINSTINKCIKVLNKIKMKDTYNLILDFRDAGSAVYELTIMADDNNALIETIRSPTSFLSGIMNGNVDVADRIIENFENKNIKKQEGNGFLKNIFLDLNSGKYPDTKDNISKAFAVYLDDINPGSGYYNEGNVNINVSTFCGNMLDSNYFDENMKNDLNIFGVMIKELGAEAGLKYAKSINLLDENKMKAYVEYFNKKLDEGLQEQNLNKDKRNAQLIKMQIQTMNANFKEENEKLIQDEELSISQITSNFNDGFIDMDLNNIVDKLGITLLTGDKRINPKSLVAYRKKGITDDVLVEYFIKTKGLNVIPITTNAKSEIPTLRKLTYQKHYKKIFPETRQGA